MNVKYILIIFVAIFFTSCSTGTNSTENRNKTTESHSDLHSKIWGVQKVVDQTIYFSNGKEFKTNLYDLKYVGQLATKDKDPYLILSGRGCTNCDENISIYIHSPSDGPMKNEDKQPRYAYPGKEYDYMDKRLLFESRMFYGTCFKDKGGCVTWTQRQLNEKGFFEESALIIEVVNDNLNETKVENNVLPHILLLNCKELSGIEIMSEP